MVIKFGAWFELECRASYLYARVGRREVLHTTRPRARSAAVTSDHAHRPTFRVVRRAADWKALVDSAKAHA